MADRMPLESKGASLLEQSRTCNLGGLGSKTLQPPLLRLLLLCSLLSMAPVAEAAGSGEGPWWKEEYEKAYVEALAIIAMVIIAILFDVVWHAIEERAESSYLYGDIHKQLEDSPGTDDGHKLSHHRLYKAFVERMGAEFMTLGILAFLIFLTNNMEGFAKLAEVVGECDADDKHCFHFPVTQYDWLHMAEETHIKLFLGMMFYFGIIIVVVLDSVEQIKTWERLRLRRLRHTTQGKVRGFRRGHIPDLDRELHKYMVWRDFFILKISAWNRTRPEPYSHIIRLLDLGNVDNMEPEEFNKMFDTVLEERFSLSQYLALNLEATVRDSIEVHWTTWTAVIVLFSLFAALHRFARWRFWFQVVIFIAVCFVIFAAMFYISHTQQKSIEKYTKCQKNKGLRKQHTKEWMRGVKEGGSSVPLSPMSTRSRACTAVGLDNAGGIHQSYNTETIILRILQVFLFLISYVFASTLVGMLDTSKIERNLLLALLFVVLYAIIAKFLPRLLPPFVAIMAIPPYVDNDNLEMLFHVLVSDHNKWMRLRNSLSMEKLSRSMRGAPSQKTDALLELADMMGVKDLLQSRLKERGKSTASQPPAMRI